MNGRVAICVALVAAFVGVVRAESPAVDRAAVGDEDLTAWLQSRIDRVSAAGGGEVGLGSGVYTVGGVFLKDGVTLRLDEGAVLQAVTNRARYPHTPGWDRGAVVMADGAKGIAIVGRGVIDGRGGAMPLSTAAGRWRCVALNRCRDVRIEDVTIRDAHSWACYLKECDGAVVRGVTIRNHCNLNNDGLDVESSNVLVENCDIDSEDDALVFKAMTHETYVTNVVVRNCRLSSNSSFIKVGSETRGVFRDIRVSDCRLEVRTRLSKRKGFADVPGGATDLIGLDGIGVSIYDGGSLDGFTAERITMGMGVGVPVFVRIGRSTRVEGTAAGGTFLRNVVIRDVSMEAPAVMRVPSTITGTPLLRPQNVRLENVLLRTAADVPGDKIASPVPEMSEEYPVGKMFAKGGLAPANALYVRHADGVVLENFKVVRGAGPSTRDTIVADDADVVRH